MRLSPFDGPCLLCETMPLAWSVPGDAGNDWEMSRYLQVLADFELPRDVLDDTQTLQAVKADLTLLWLARTLKTPLPSDVEVVMGLESVAWCSDVPLPIGQQGVVTFCLSKDFPMLLKFKAQIKQCIFQSFSYVIYADWLPMRGVLLDSFEKTVFRYHRRYIQQIREQQQ
ncbi:hypothetical protein [Deefgea salmonis]|uniref:Cyclic di-GMP receptor atypical PilZ domain-containing protein n=1 Tax=Deefgea salmonis TaxID=2875502 RepID=A0ABS8BH67_9NEIS|nr:hypothetical protein [Deefgea salmonis]MCB5194941.1 hypothetical protein [Deefgea salmonis]